MSCKKLNNEFKQAEGSNVKEDWAVCIYCEYLCQGTAHFRYGKEKSDFFFSVTEPTHLLT